MTREAIVGKDPPAPEDWAPNGLDDPPEGNDLKRRFAQPAAKMARALIPAYNFHLTYGELAEVLGRDSDATRTLVAEGLKALKA